MIKPFPDVEDAFIDWAEQTYPELAPETGERHVDTEVPAGVKKFLPFVWVRLVGGADDTVTDRSVVDIDVLADSRASAYALAEDIRSRFSGRSHRIGDVVLDRVTTETKPSRRPWADQTIVRFGATYRVSARR